MRVATQRCCRRCQIECDIQRFVNPRCPVHRQVHLGLILTAGSRSAASDRVAAAVACRSTTRDFVEAVLLVTDRVHSTALVPAVVPPKADRGHTVDRCRGRDIGLGRHCSCGARYGNASECRKQTSGEVRGTHIEQLIIPTVHIALLLRGNGSCERVVEVHGRGKVRYAYSAPMKANGVDRRRVFKAAIECQR